MEATITVSVKRFNDSKKSAWDEYVDNSSKATFFHLSGWKNVLEKTFGYKPYYLYAESEGKICGLLPLFMMRNLRFKKAMISIPFGVYGGVCADNQEIACLLNQEAKRITRLESAEYLELKNINPLEDGLLTKELYATFIKELPAKKEDCLERQPRKARAASRKAISFGLKTEIGIHLLGECYHIYAVSLRNLGTPVMPSALFKNIAAEFKDKVTVLSVKLNNKTIASVLTFLFKDTVMPYYGGCLAEYSNYQPNNFMYLKLMEWGVENRFKYFDFGRSKKGTGSYKFKQYQGFEPKQLYYQYYLHKLKEIPDTSPLNPKYALAIKVWKKLPISLTKCIGPRVVKYIGG